MAKYLPQFPGRRVERDADSGVNRRHLDLDAGWLRIDPGETKNREGREFPTKAVP